VTDIKLEVRKPEQAASDSGLNMNNTKSSVIVFFVTLSIATAVALQYRRDPAQEISLVKINREYEKQTVVQPSRIPNAGNGLFAAIKIKKGDVIGELGGRLVPDGDESLGNHYIASIPECAWEKTNPYKYINAKEHAGHVSRINFAPSEINGVKTNLQNAAIKQICESPYFLFVALRDIEPGEEIWSSYGPDYEYSNFMGHLEVRDFFCGLLKIDCSEEYTFSH
jgi:hypothetical protein